MRRLLWLAPLALAAAGINPDSYLGHVRYLASDELKGRATGSPGLEKAAAYIEKQFRADRLTPPAGRSFEQTFPVVLNAHLGKENTFRVADDGKKEDLRRDRDFIPFSFSSSGKYSGAVVFAGYGITAAEYHYDDYAGIDVHGKMVLILRHEPQELDEKSIFAGKQLTTHAEFASKAANAKMHGARGVILINDVYQHPGEQDALEKFGRAAGPNDSGVLFVEVKAAAAETWLKASGHELKAISGGINRDLKPESFPVEGLDVNLDVEVARDTRNVPNVAAYKPGETDEYVVIGAHYDHLGLGDEHSLAPSQIGKIHPGADDNASGTAGVIELAKFFASQPKQKRGILFITFAGEELGLLGSQWYADHPMLPIANAVAMINMDMIGRVHDDRIFVEGTGTGSTFAKLIDEVAPHTTLHMDLSEKTGYGASDHTSFTAKQVPVLFFFSGLHGDYHKPSDTWDKINAPGAAKVLDLVADIAERLASAPERPRFVHVAEPSMPVSGAGGGSGYGPNFGSIPDFSEPPKGVRFADIKAGSPADKAGLKAGDILIEFDGKDIGNLYDFTYALRAKKPGDLVLVRVLRGSQTIEAKVLLTERK